MLFLRKHNLDDSYQNLSDDELIKYYKETMDREFAAILFQRYVDKVYLVTRKYIADRELSKDIVMNVFEKVLRHLPTTEIKTFGNWLHTITKNECHQFHRMHSSQSQKLQEWKNLEENLGNNVENDSLHHLIHEEEHTALHEKLHQAIESLKDHQRICIRLFYFERKSYKEIAGITGYSEKEVKSYIQHGRNNLKKFMTRR